MMMRKHIRVGERRITDQLTVAQTLVEQSRNKIIDMQDLFCDCYCKFPDEYYSMYKDVDDALENLLHEKCDMCPIAKLL